MTFSLLPVQTVPPTRACFRRGLDCLADGGRNRCFLLHVRDRAAAGKEAVPCPESVVMTTAQRPAPAMGDR